MSEIQHGRRKGSSRAEEGSREMTSSRLQGIVEDIMENENENKKKTVALDRMEMRRIYHSACDYDEKKEEIKRRAAERLEKYESCKELRKQMPGCSVNQREEKIARVKQMEADLEAKRCEVDREEARFQAQKRQEMMEEARKVLNWQSDRYKNFNTALLTDETMRERNIQIELQKKMAEEKKQREKDDSERLRICMEEMLAKEAREEAAKKKYREDVAEFHKYQMRQHEQAREKEKEDGLKEKEEIDKAYAEYLVLSKDNSHDKNLRYKKHLYDHMQKQAENARTEQNHVDEEDKERRVIALAKKQLLCKKLAHEQKKKEEKDAVKDSLYKKLAKYFADKGDDYEEMVRKAKEEVDAKKDAEEAAKAERRRKAMEDMVVTNKKIVQELEEKAIQQKEEENRDMAAKREAALIFAQNERKKAEARRRDEEHAEHYNKRLRVRQVENVQEQRNMSLAIDWFNEMNSRKREKDFQEYADNTIAEMKGRGGPTYAMEKDKARVLAMQRTCGDEFIGKGTPKPPFMTDEEMNQYMERLDIKEDQRCLEIMRNREDDRYKHCSGKG